MDRTLSETRASERNAGNGEALPASAMSEGQRLLRARSESYAELGAMVGANKSTVCRWVSGEKAPGSAARAKLETELGIPAASWGERAQAGDARPATPVARATAIAKMAVRSDEDERLQGLLDQMASIELDGLLATEKARILQMHADVLNKLAARRERREEREAQRQAEREIKMAAHPSFTRVVEALLAALRPYPEALEAARDALREAID